MLTLKNIFLSMAAVSLLMCSPAHAGSTPDQYGGRDMIVYVPAQLPPVGARALVVVLHGGMGNASRIAERRGENGLNMDAVAGKNGFIVAYLNGSPAGRLFSSMHAWNAGGGCCGLPWRKNVDDIAYVTGAVGYLAGKYGIDSKRIFGIGHSNGAMMSQLLMCKTDLYAAIVAVSGPLNVQDASCPSARGKRILAIHGENDANVPIAGGEGTKGISGVAFNSEENSRRIFEASGASYTLLVVKGADHRFDHIDAGLQEAEGQTIAQKAARFFGLSQ